MLRSLRLFLFGLALAASVCLPSSGITASSVSSVTLPATIDISALTTFLGTLPPDEQEEQLRDWVCYGIKSALGLPAAPELPVRHSALRKTAVGEISPGRVFPLSEKEWGMLVPESRAGDRPLLGGLMDGARVAADRLPDSVALFTYRYDSAAAAIRVAAAGSITCRSFFTPEYGYYAATVRSRSDLSSFLERIDDILLLEWRSDGIVLGGRRSSETAGRGLTLDAVATLYQAYHPPERKGKRHGKDREPNIGFSLDPAWDYRKLAEELDGLADRLGSIESGHASRKGMLGSLRPSDLKGVASRVRRRRDVSPLLELRRRLKDAPAMNDRRMGDHLQGIADGSAYQAARYDGNLQGSRVGMILFQTDLLAKLWAIDYEGIVPRGVIPGLRPMTEIPVPRLYWDDLLRLSKTRLWFGLRSEGFDIHRERLLFRPCATRVYAASSDPLKPGKESRPNYPSGEFLGWWDRHYETIADYEPSFHQLNQIQKWSCVIMVLQEKRLSSLDFLRAVPVERRFDFETWINENRTGKAGKPIPFLDRKRYGRTTECLPLFQSKPYPLMGKSFTLSGGVSLASRKDILAKLHQEVATSPGTVKQRTAGAGKAQPSHVAGGGAQERTAGKRAARPASTTGRPEGAGKGRGAGSGGSAYGTFRAEKRPGTITLRWDKGPAVALHDCVAGLASLQDASGGMAKGEALVTALSDIRSAVRLREGDIYLIRTAATGNEWIYLRINPPDIDRYPVRAAGSTPDADIFGARLVSEAEAQKLAEGKPVIR